MEAFVYVVLKGSKEKVTRLEKQATSAAAQPMSPRVLEARREARRLAARNAALRRSAARKAAMASAPLTTPADDNGPIESLTNEFSMTSIRQGTLLFLLWCTTNLYLHLI
jgi:hypothetical protein